MLRLQTPARIRRGIHAWLLSAALCGASGCALVAPVGPHRVAPHRQAEIHRGPVVLLHGLGRSRASMGRMARALAAEGFDVCTVGYPSRRHTVAVLARSHVLPAVRACFPDPKRPLAFVTHSLGGILVRQLAADGAGPAIGRVVMLGPPNGGSEVVDRLGGLWAFGALNGPAGRELGTDAASVPSRLGPAPFEVGILAGDRTINVGLSLLLPSSDDGKVTVARTALPGARDHIVLPVAHPYLMTDREAIRQTIRFLVAGRFAPARRP